MAESLIVHCSFLTMLAVTTRNKLRSRRFFAPMLYASWQVRRQLADTPGIARFTTGISGLTEFYTLTIWESKTAMFQFTASGNHRRMMWLFTRWSDSFWSMRWLPTADEVGQCKNLSLAQTTGGLEQVNGSPAWLARSEVAEALRPFIDVQGRPDKRELDPSNCGITAVLATLPTHSPVIWQRLRQLTRHYQNRELLLRSQTTISVDGYLHISLWPEQARGEIGRFMDKMAAFMGEGWLMRCEAGNYEIGNWNGMRLRYLTRHHHESLVDGSK